MIPDPAAEAGRQPHPDDRPVPWGLLPESAAVGDDGWLSVGGCSTADLAREHGTPLFVYDEDHLRARCREAVATFGDGVSYAARRSCAWPWPASSHEEGMHLDVATGGEMHVALSAGVPADRLVLHGNNKSEAELARARDAGVGRIVVDSFDELDRLDRLHAADGRRPRVLLRATPGVEAHTHEFVQTGQVDSKFGFGVAAGDLGKAVERAAAIALRRAGRASTPTSAARCSWPPSSARPSTSSPPGSATSTCPSCPSAAASASPTWPARRPRRWPSGAGS